MEAARALRTQVVREDADDSSELSVPYPPGDALDFAVAPEAVWPDWHCDKCSSPNDGWRYVCGFCGTLREDADACG